MRLDVRHLHNVFTRLHFYTEGSRIRSMRWQVTHVSQGEKNVPYTLKSGLVEQ